MTASHLEPFPGDTVSSLCNRAEKLAFDSYSVRQEINAFRQSGTPWDARRMANALSWYGKEAPADDRIADFVEEIDRLVEEACGLKVERLA